MILIKEPPRQQPKAADATPRSGKNNVPVLPRKRQPCNEGSFGEWVWVGYSQGIEITNKE